MNRPAVFLDRDGTLLHDTGYMSDAERVELLPGVGTALASMAGAGFTLVVVTNQSGIDRGLITPRQLTEIHAKVDEKLLDFGVRIAAWEYCPHLPDAGCACRKPGTAMHTRAAQRLGLDLTRSWYVGDRLADLLPATALGGQAALVLTGQGQGWRAESAGIGATIVDDLKGLAKLLS